MPKLILTIGPSSCGKSTWADNYANQHPNVHVYSRDGFRYHSDGSSRFGDHITREYREHLINGMMTKLVCNSLADGYDVIIADTNINPKSRQHWSWIADNYNATRTYVVFDKVLNRLLVDPTYAKNLSIREHMQIQYFKNFIDNFENPFIQYIYPDRITTGVAA